MTKPILIVGDVILDAYLHGAAHKLSPEAPVPVIEVDETKIEYRLGGAANVAANIIALGGEVHLVGVCGYDQAANVLDEELKKMGISRRYMHRDQTKPTTVKKRILANGIQIARLDTECCEEVCPVTEITSNLIAMCGAVIVSDYAKGIVTPQLMIRLEEMCFNEKVPLFIDPKVSNAHKYKAAAPYRGMAVLTPNKVEAAGLAHLSPYTGQVWDRIHNHFQIPSILITKGSEGMTLFVSPDENYRDALTDTVTDIPAAAKTVFDVSGAGDTVIATLALAYSRGLTMLESAKLANLAAGIAVGKPGTSVVWYTELLKAALDAGMRPF